MADKPLLWLGSALDDLREFPARAQRLAGYQLGLVQRRLLPSDWKPLKGLGLGVHEIRIHTGQEHRVVYVARFPEAVYVLHAFEKRRQRTSRLDLELVRTRLAALIARRQRDEEH